ncbi:MULTISPECIES: XRE family transcriptional regulator [Vibrio]|uniref:XRE family transcriptional regulator n=1 Tax=Vibrio TaxID=662 RepID=UPI0009039175|nr:MULTISPECIES: XRE family transcriptional regulator [Vibrio]APF66588.1 helix-turn-helix protein [Vibrio cholerae]MCC4237798.1 XRE family transcriptional regulator [Vibrio anguillarum]TVM18169.1 ImmA/IrrE family metallo-endopeptidase [Vibrio cholerae]TVM35519.1 ImmA/IrrE family metallo-endopeptidase [Vibrio cholerae]GHZ42323.1 helix-turn-helix protein [Vibrio cholerae]
MATQALINPQIVTWARKRAGLSEEAFAQKLGIKKVDRVVEWEAGTSKPTFVQAQKIASATNIPFGYLFLVNPPKEELPIPDLRTIGNKHRDEVSVEMRDIIKQVMYKQEWYKEYLRQIGEDELPFVGRFSTKNTVYEVAQNIRGELEVPLPQKGSWEDYQRQLISAAENSRILVMRSGIVGNNTRRKLEVNEFRGFAISDKLAPVIFINSSDAPAARLFTLVHELAHLWIGSSGVSDLGNEHAEEEKFCNAVAGEFLVPEKEFQEMWNPLVSLLNNAVEISSRFHVSKLVVAKRALDCGAIDSDTYWEFYQREMKAFKRKKSSGGDFNITAGARNSALFSSAVVAEAMSGRMLLRDAGSLLGIQPSKIKTYASKLAL